jgi:hypothetical protein
MKKKGMLFWNNKFVVLTDEPRLLYYEPKSKLLKVSQLVLRLRVTFN